MNWSIILEISTMVIILKNQFLHFFFNYKGIIIKSLVYFTSKVDIGLP